MDFFVIEIDENGVPQQLVGPSTFEKAKEVCAKIAEENNVSPDLIFHEIMEDDINPGSFFNNLSAGVWVISND